MLSFADRHFSAGAKNDAFAHAAITRELEMTTSPGKCDLGPSDIAKAARGALERVCSGAGLDSPSRYYSPAFVDHVNDFQFYGHADIQKSVDLYTGVLSGIKITVEEQLVDGNQVTSRFMVTGVNRGRRVCFNGITISRFDNGLIVEDWSVTDTVGMLRQLGLWRSVLVGLQHWNSLRTMTRGPVGTSAELPLVRHDY